VKKNPHVMHAYAFVNLYALNSNQRRYFRSCTNQSLFYLIFEKAELRSCAIWGVKIDEWFSLKKKGK